MRNSRATAMCLVFALSIVMFAVTVSAADCWNFNNNEANCNLTSGCAWNNQGNFCDMINCNNYITGNTCTAKAAAGCSWNSGGWCSESSCWDNKDQASCEDASCHWNDGQFCEQIGAWMFTNQSSCGDAGFTWVSSGGWCYEHGCWEYGNQSA